VDAGLRRHDVVGVMLGLGCFHAWLDCRASLAMTFGRSVVYEMALVFSWLVWIAALRSQ
jgi:hypothetical protein